MIIGLSGTFASGKDTLAHHLVQVYNFMHISTGDMVRAVADFSELQSAANKAQTTMKNMSDSVNHSMKRMSTDGINPLAAALGGLTRKLVALAGTYVGLSFIADATNDAIKFEASMEALNNRLGASSAGFQEWARTTGRAMGYSQGQVAEYGNTFSNMLRQASTSQEDLAKKTEKILETSAIIRSKSSFSQEEILKRVRSAMNQEADGAEELGINVRTTAIEHSKAFKELANGVKSFSNLSLGQQKAILYQHILNEVTKNYGDTLANNTSTKMAVFVASLKDLKLHLGQAFLPILNAVLPTLSKLVGWLDIVAQKIGIVMRLLFGYKASDTTSAVTVQTDAFNDQADAVSGLADSHKKLKGSLASFDQINTLSEPDAGKGGGGKVTSGGGYLNDSAKQTDGLTQQMSEFAEKVKEAFKKIMQDPNVKEFIKHFKDMTQSFKDLKKSLEDFYNSPAVQKILDWMGDKLWESFWNARSSDAMIIDGIVEGMAGWLDVATGLLNLDWDKIKEGFGEIYDGAGKTFEGVGKIFGFDKDDIIKFWKEALNWENFKSHFETLRTDVQNAWGWIKDDVWPYLGQPVVDAVKTTWDSVVSGEWWAGVKESVNTAWTSVKDAVDPAWTPIADAVKTAWGKVKSGEWWSGIKTTVGNAWTLVKDAVAGSWSLISTEVKTAWGLIKSGEWWSGMKTVVGTVWTNIKDAVGTSWSLISTEVKTAWGLIKSGDWWDGLKTTVGNVWTKIKDAVGTAWTPIKDAVKTAVNSIIDDINKFLSKVSSIKISIPSVNIPGVGAIGGGSIGFPDLGQIPRLAKGGITNGAMTAIIGDNPGGREVVSPLNDLTGHISTAVIQALKFTQPSGNRDSGKQGDIILNIDGRQFARIVKPYLDNANGNTTVMLNRI